MKLLLAPIIGALIVITVCVGLYALMWLLGTCGCWLFHFDCNSPIGPIEGGGIIIIGFVIVVLLSILGALFINVTK